MTPVEFAPDLVFGATGPELRRRTGSISQVARVDSLVHADGPARGSRLIRMIGAAGLEIDIHPDRALDLGLARFRGIPLTWLSPTGFAAPGLTADDGTRWLRTFGGGLLTTCGLESFGPASVDEGRAFGLHDRVSGLPAMVVTAGIVDDVLTVSGVIRQCEVLGSDLVLERTLRMPVGAARLEIVDRVTNRGFEPAGHMVLYHLNFGWPLVHEDAVVTIDSAGVSALNAAAEAAPGEWRTVGPPREGAQEHVYLHDFRDRATGAASIDNPTLGVRVAVEFAAESLPALIQWLLPAEGHYVLGLEPANTPHLGGRASASRSGLLARLAPGASVEHRMTISAGPSLVAEEGA